MSGFAYSLLGFLAAIAILVAVHEYGHFQVARKLGVKVLKFSIGFGKPVVAWRRKGDPTEYCIGIIPLGGYVKMLDEHEGEVDPGERGMAFNRQSLGARSAIVAAGPAYNFLFAIFAIWLVLVAGSDDIEPLIGAVAENSAAQQAGFRTGDRLVRIDGREVRTWGQHQFYLTHQAMKGNTVDFEVAGNDGGQRSIPVDFSAFDQYTIGNRPIPSQIGLSPPAPPAEVFRIVPDSPAERAGLQPGDRVTAIDATPIGDWGEMVEYVSSRPGQGLSLSVRRDGRQLEIQLTTEAVRADGREFGRIGLYRPPLQNATLRYGPLAAIPASLDYNWRMTVVTLRSLGRMLSARMSSDNLSGPITIARLAGHTIEAGYTDFLKFLAIISISLGLINLLPIPLLDGGHLLYFAIEAVKGSPPSRKAMLWGQQLGIAVLVLLMGVAFYNDIMRLF
ncbi:MAG: RIP metalloprotease RseP [Gammaproteobacteria bacterium]|nr:RIP metalloprotease RseP [Gammaproteobacteria bacterium]